MISLKPNRRWFQYRLRTLLIAIAVCGVAFRVLAEPVFNAHRQARAVDAIQASGGHVYWCQGSPIFPDWVPGWSMSICGCGERYSQIWISHIYLSLNAGDAQLGPVADCPNLKVLVMKKSHVTDAGLAQLRNLRQLAIISAQETQITDAGLAELQSLPGLKRLDLSGTRVTRKGIEKFRHARPDCQVNGFGGSDGD